MSTQYLATYDKDPDATLDYSIDWSAWLPSGDAISTAAWSTSDAELVVEGSPAPSVSAGVATVWLSGGTAGTHYTVTCRVTTTGGRIDDRSIRLRCVER
jgi:hypothetical protein